MEVIKDISPAVLEQIAIKYMGIRNHEIQDISVAVREQIDMKKYQILELWRNRYSGPDAKAALLEILSKAQQQGLISRDAYKSLMENQTGQLL